MFFSKVARMIAILGLLLGLVNIGIAALVISQPTPEQREAALKAFMPSYSTTGEAIDRAIYVILGSIALGTLAEIGILSGRKADAPSGSKMTAKPREPNTYDPYPPEKESVSVSSLKPFRRD